MIDCYNVYYFYQYIVYSRIPYNSKRIKISFFFLIIKSDMQKVADYIFNLSPKKIAIYLVLGPLILFLVYTIIIITFSIISEESHATQVTFTMLLSFLSVFFGIFLSLWFVWLRCTVYSVEEAKIGLARRGFKIA